jgi:hypothetical protein
MCTNLKTLAITSVLFAGALGALTLQAHQGAEGTGQEGPMMGQGSGMMNKMEQMDQMMENCNKMMQVMRQKMEKQQGEPQQPGQALEETN